MNAETFPVRNTPAARERLFVRLYEQVFPVVAAYVHRKGGNADQARDIFQDALVIYYEKTAAGEAPQTTEEGYIFGICRHLWTKQFHAGKTTAPLDPAFGHAEEETAHPSSERLSRYLAVAGKKCMQLLQGFYYHRLPMEELAEEFGYSGGRSATVQKHKCIEKLRAEVKQKALTYSDFYE